MFVHMICSVHVRVRVANLPTKQLTVQSKHSSHRHSLERTNPRDLIPRMNNRRRPPLSARQYDVDKVGGRGHWRHLLEVVDWHDWAMLVVV
jgi:hypothetical protein